MSSDYKKVKNLVFRLKVVFLRQKLVFWTTPCFSHQNAYLNAIILVASPLIELGFDFVFGQAFVLDNVEESCALVIANVLQEGKIGPAMPSPMLTPPTENRDEK